MASEQPSSRRYRATVYWDLETCPVPAELKGYQIVTSIKKFVSQSDSNLNGIYAFGNINQTTLTLELQSELQQCGVEFHDTKSGVGMALLIELLKFACDNIPPYKIVLMTGNGSLATAVETLTNRGYQVHLVHTTDAPDTLTSRSTFNLEWKRFLSRYSPIGAHLYTAPTSASAELLSSTESSFRSDTYRTFGDSKHGFFSESVRPVVDTTTRTSPPSDGFNGFHDPFKSFINETQRVNDTPYRSNEPYRAQNDWSRVVSKAPERVISNENLRTNENMRRPYDRVFQTENSKTTDSEASALLKEVLQTLKKEMFRPTEKTIEASLKRNLVNQGRALTSEMWDRIMTVAARSHEFKVMGMKPKRVIYEARDMYGGIDPIYPPKVDFDAAIWADFKNFLNSRHPLSKNGRYRFAEYLRKKGPVSIQELPLARIAQLVEVAIVRKILCFKGGVICSVASLNNVNADCPRTSEPEEIERVKTEIISFLQSRGGNVQIGTLSGHLIQMDMIEALRPYGGLKTFIEETRICKLIKDARHGLFVSFEIEPVRSSIHSAVEFVRDHGGKVNIGTLSSFLRRNGLLDKMKEMGGMKKCLESTKLFAFENEIDNTTYVRLLRNLDPSPNRSPESHSSDSTVENFEQVIGSPVSIRDTGREAQARIDRDSYSLPAFNTEDDLEDFAFPKTFLTFDENDSLDFSKLVKQLTADYPSLSPN